MVHIGLTGNRYSGKDRVAKLFKQIHIPVFDADVVLRFAINYNIELLKKLKLSMGEYYFDNVILNMDRVRCDNKFGEVIDFFKEDIFNAFDRFNKKNSNSVYTIFHSSILFESGWDKKMDQTISVFSPINSRIERCQFLTEYKLSEIHKLIKTEIDELEKNKLSTYVIHNYELIGRDTLDSVCDTDQKIINFYLYDKLSEQIENQLYD
jgi:dephospho-CoA kinase